MTVAELRERMSVAEFQAWVAYVEEMGPLNLNWRIDLAIARAVAACVGGEDTIQKLMPWPKEEERVATAEDIARILRGTRQVETR